MRLNTNNKLVEDLKEAIENIFSFATEIPDRFNKMIEIVGL